MKVRHPHFFDGQELDKYWFGGNPYSTHLAAAYNVLFPDGEMYFIRSVKKHKKYIKDDKLKEEVRIFVGQEAEHMLSTRALLDSFQPAIKKRTRFFHAIYKYSFLFIEKVFNLLAPTLNLSITASMEQYTAIFGEAVYDEELWTEIPDSVTGLLRWHLAEEIEHKAVAFNVMKARGVRYPMRILGFLTGSMILFGYAILGFLIYCLTDFELYRRPIWALKQFGRFIANWKDATLRQVPLVLKYLKPSYHPDMIEHPPGAEVYLDSQDFARFENSGNAPKKRATAGAMV